MSRTEVENLTRLSDLLEVQSWRWPLARAEILRELGHFAECIRIIEESILGERANGVAQFILELAQRAEASVLEIRADPDRYWRARRRRHRRVEALRVPSPAAPGGPAVFAIESRDWWFKVLGDRCHRWALIDDSGVGKATVYLFNDLGEGTGGAPGCRRANLEGRSAVVASIDLESVAHAERALRRDRFERLEDHPGPWDGYEPRGISFDARGHEPEVDRSKV